MSERMANSLEEWEMNAALTRFRGERSLETALEFELLHTQ